MIKELHHLECITLFVENLPEAKAFYVSVFNAKPVFEDNDSQVLKLENVALNLLKISAAPELITPAKVGSQGAGARMMFTILVKDVNSVCSALERQGVKLLNGPIDRPWGRRTAAFQDPAGHAWEIAQEI